MTQSDKALSHYLGDNSSFSLPCGTNVSLYFVGDLATCGASDETPEKGCVDLVDFGPLYPNQHHVLNL